MELTVAERAALRSLVRQQRAWRWWRYVSLAIGVSIIVGGIWWHCDLTQGLYDTTRRMSSTVSPTGAEVYFASRYGGLLALFDLAPGLGGAVIGVTLGCWRGNRVHRLLIAFCEREAGQQ